MPYDHEEETGTIEQIKKGERVITDDGRLGIFERADISDITKEKVDYQLKEYDELYDKFVGQMGYMGYENDAIYYHHNIEGGSARLDMAVSILGKNPISTDYYFILDYKKAYQYDIPLLMVKLDDRLGMEGKTNQLTVWGYNRSEKKFTEPRTVKSVEDNQKIYSDLKAYLNNWDSRKDAFFKIASSIYRF